MNPIGWVEIPVTDLDRAEKFYEDYFGKKTERQPERQGFIMSWFDMDMKAYGAAATLIKGEGHVPGTEGPLVYFTAPGDTVEAGIAKAKEMDVEIIKDKHAAGENAEHGYYAIIKDSEGNAIAIHSMKG